VVAGSREHGDRAFAILPRPRDRWARLRIEGLGAAAVAAAATGGALVGFGLREGGALDAFTGAGRRMLGIAATEGGTATARALLAGVTAHLFVCLLWGLLFAALSTRRRPWHAALTALLLAGAVYSAADLWLPAVLRLGYGLYATRPQHVLLHLLLAGGLWVGTRLAQYRPRSA
jgi:hypothetical protein